MTTPDVEGLVEVTDESLARFFDVVLPHMNELQRRVVAGAAAQMLGRGGKSAVAQASGMSRNTVIKAEGEVAAGIQPSLRLRAPGGGDKSLLDTQPGLLDALGKLISPECEGISNSKLRWTSKSSTTLANELVSMGFEVSSRSVLRLLHKLGYSLQANGKSAEGCQRLDRDAQFRYLNDLSNAFIDDDQPVICVDTKQKELHRSVEEGGSKWASLCDSDRGNGNGGLHPDLGEYGKAIPDGIYGVFNSEGWASAGDTTDTADFTVESIRRWWNQIGQSRYPSAHALLIAADAGSSSSCRSQAWKKNLSDFALEAGLAITVCHYPNSTSKWDTIEHRMVSFVTLDLPGHPHATMRTIVDLISETVVNTGLSVQADYYPSWYPKSVKIGEGRSASALLNGHPFHGEWNFSINAQSVLS
jgi:transposase